MKKNKTNYKNSFVEDRNFQVPFVPFEFSDLEGPSVVFLWAPNCNLIPGDVESWCTGI